MITDDNPSYNIHTVSGIDNTLIISLSDDHSCNFTDGHMLTYDYDIIHTVSGTILYAWKCNVINIDFTDEHVITDDNPSYNIHTSTGIIIYQGSISGFYIRVIYNYIYNRYNIIIIIYNYIICYF